MPKRKNSDSLYYIVKKLKFLEKEIKSNYGRSRHHRSNYSSSDSSSLSSAESSANGSPEDYNGRALTQPSPPRATSPQPSTSRAEVAPEPRLSELFMPQPPPCPNQSELNPEIMSILGIDPTSIVDNGSPINPELANRLTFITMNGLKEEERQEFSKKYLIPENCPSITPPIMNAEIKAALPEPSLKRDKNVEARQRSVATAISCLSKTITIQLNSNEPDHELLQHLVDTARMLCDIQYNDSMSRRHCALTTVKKDLRDQISSLKIEKYLFGDNLGEALKTAKAVTKSGADLKSNSKKLEDDQRNTQAGNRSAGIEMSTATTFSPACTQQRISPPTTQHAARTLLEHVVASSPTNTEALTQHEACYAGRLTRFSDQWSKITNDHILMSWINGYKIHFDKPVVQSTPAITVISSESEYKQNDTAIQHLLSIGAISECETCPDQFVSKVFLIPKPNGTKRFILNLKTLNKSIKTQHFKMEDTRTVLKLISKDCFMATVDLKDAYMLINIDYESRKYLRFCIQRENSDIQKMYEFKVLPFGLCTAPYVFTKLLKPVFKLLRSCGYLSSCYLDDFCLMGETRVECNKNILATQQLLQSLGFIINWDKSSLIPSHSCRYLGFIIDSKLWHVSLPEEKRLRIKNELLHFTQVKRCKIRKFSQLVGLLVSACPAVEYGWMHIKEMERLKFINLQYHNDYDRYMTLPTSIEADIQWWIKVIDNTVHRIIDDIYCREIYSDASKSGWGSACGSESAGGQWSDIEKQQHINYLELLAAFFSLKIFAKDCYHCQILLRVDNTTAVSYINRMGGKQYPHLTKIARNIWQWCEDKKIFVTASYVKSTDNIIADRESRKSHPDAEWELLHHDFQKVVSR